MVLLDQRAIWELELPEIQGGGGVQNCPCALTKYWAGHGLYGFGVQVCHSFMELLPLWSHYCLQPSSKGPEWPIPLDRSRKIYAFDPSLRSYPLLSYNLIFYTIAQSSDLYPLPPVQMLTDRSNWQEPGYLIIFSLQVVSFINGLRKFHSFSFPLLQLILITGCFQQWSTCSYLFLTISGTWRCVL